MSQTYDSSSIQVLEGLEAVRKRPAMYIGDTSAKGLHHCVFEVLDNSIDEAMGGFATKIDVVIKADGSVRVDDDGRGIPVDIHPTEGVPAVQVIMCKLHAGGKFDKESYQVSGGLHGVGVSCVNALSEWLNVEIHRDGATHTMSFGRGAPTTELARTGDTDKHGTTVVFKPDDQIFDTLEFSYEVLSNRMRELAFLMGKAGVVLTLLEEATERSESFHYPNGLVDFVDFINETKEPVHAEVISLEAEGTDAGGKPVLVEVAFQYNGGYREDIYTFVNNINTGEGGTHLSGFRSGLTRVLNNYAKKGGLLKPNEVAPSGEDFREGLAVVLSVKLQDPQFESQTKIKLGNRDVEGIVASAVNDKLTTHLEENPSVGKAIINKALLAARAREAARKQRDLVRRKGALASGNLPGKLADCTSKNRDETELYIVEGDSAGGTAKMARDRAFQAILPLRGKILNVEKARLDKMLNHEEIQTLITALGTGFGDDEFDLEKLRYGKVIIMTDADVDGSHIRTLLLTFFFRQMAELVTEGRIYIAAPPLFKLRRGKKERYILDEAGLKAALLDLGDSSAELEVLATGARMSGNELGGLVEQLVALELAEERISQARHGLTLPQLVERGVSGRLPRRVVRTPDGERHAFTDQETCDEFLKGLGEAKAEECLVSEVPQAEGVEKRFEALAGLGFSIEDYLGVPREPSVSGPSDDSDEPPARFLVHADGKAEPNPVETLRGVLAGIRAVGEKGVDIQRYKGLGEMNADQLWDSTMNPETRMLYSVVLEDMVEADHLFSVLMGPGVEQRREFIQRHALEVRNLDV